MKASRNRATQGVGKLATWWSEFNPAGGREFPAYSVGWFRYLDVSVDDFVGQLRSFGLPAWMVEAFAVAVANPEIPGDQSSAEVESILHRKPATLEQFIKDYCAAFQA